MRLLRRAQHLGCIFYSQSCWDDAATSFEKAVQTHRFNENEYIIDTYFWLAHHAPQAQRAERGPRLPPDVADSEVRYDKKPQAVELLQRIA
jgi:hypothetical protein